MSEEITVQTPTSQGGGLMKNLGIYMHGAEIAMILGSAFYFYSKTSKLEAKIEELEKKIASFSHASPETAKGPSVEERRKEMNDLATFLYNKIHEDLEAEKQKKKKKRESRHEGIDEVVVATASEPEIVNEEYDENELKKEM